MKFIENNQEYHQRTSLLKMKGKGEPERENLLSVSSDGRLHPRKNCEKKLCKMFFIHRRGREAFFFKFCKLKQKRRINQQQNLESNRYELL